MGYIKSVDRNQARIVALDSMVAADSPAKLVDAFVDSQDMAALGFAPPAAEGRPAYDPRSMLKLYVWVYRKGVMYMSSENCATNPLKSVPPVPMPQSPPSTIP